MDELELAMLDEKYQNAYKFLIDMANKIDISDDIIDNLSILVSEEAYSCGITNINKLYEMKPSEYLKFCYTDLEKFSPADELNAINNATYKICNSTKSEEYMFLPAICNVINEKIEDMVYNNGCSAECWASYITDIINEKYDIGINFSKEVIDEYGEVIAEQGENEECYAKHTLYGEYYGISCPYDRNLCCDTSTVPPSTDEIYDYVFEDLEDLPISKIDDDVIYKEIENVEEKMAESEVENYMENNFGNIPSSNIFYSECKDVTMDNYEEVIDNYDEVNLNNEELLNLIQNDKLQECLFEEFYVYPKEKKE